ncbi:putative diacylglycerol acyltransferase family protein [Phaeoacremonium minimum UCRPA7]|uniref:Putative diacylglycerol acyltransferase family protein n=1 Tax=Phaeoacremonium minimum (strain UCR-PA7) TaxID=1286976 RepID=R8BWM2_PHAM7|nr:putative diacylglycerol acyltransferase family protein [Phaeoacremonium minimum UCRPA7]EOO03753.1 putative diacylglycerol acyltransferase family protein [Phaeoacremonium minimum UCRPA7]
MENRKALLFFTNSEWGQANVILATIHEFLVRDRYEIHLASYSPLKKRVQELFITHANSYPRPFTVAFTDEERTLSLEDKVERPSLTFHTIPGLSVAETCHRDHIAHTLPHAPGFKGAVASYRRLAEFFIRYTVDEYMETENYAKQTILTVKPALVLAEQGCNPGIDACNELGIPFSILSPNSFKDFEQYLQPRLAILWKYPALSSAFPYPLPWSLIPINIYFWLRMLFVIVGAALDKKSRLATVTKGRHKHGLRGPIPIVDAYKKAAAIICPSLPELDFSMGVRPTTTGCGPIVLPVHPVAELDPELSSWIQVAGKRTILVNLGTHYSMDLELAIEVARALLTTLSCFSDIQILWKIMLRSDQQHEVEAVFGEHVASGRIRMQAWLKPDPVALLETGRIAVQVHHGGANTYFECCRAGVPQVVLAAWWDTYEYAARVEYLSIGVFANKQAAPRAKTTELESALKRVVGDGEMRLRAEELARTCQQHGEGRVVAHDRIVHLAQLAVPGYYFEKGGVAC